MTFCPPATAGFTATHGSTSLFTQLTSPGIRSPEMSHDANGLADDAWCTPVVVYTDAEAEASGRTTLSADATTAGPRARFLIEYLPRRNRKPPIFLT